MRAPPGPRCGRRSPPACSGCQSRSAARAASRSVPAPGVVSVTCPAPVAQTSEQAHQGGLGAAGLVDRGDRHEPAGARSEGAGRASPAGWGMRLTSRAPAGRAAGAATVSGVAGLLSSRRPRARLPPCRTTTTISGNGCRPTSSRRTSSCAAASCALESATGDRALDLGCGEGAFTAELSRRRGGCGGRRRGRRRGPPGAGPPPRARVPPDADRRPAAVRGSELRRRLVQRGDRARRRHGTVAVGGAPRPGAGRDGCC